MACIEVEPAMGRHRDVSVEAKSPCVPRTPPVAALHAQAPRISPIERAFGFESTSGFLAYLSELSLMSRSDVKPVSQRTVWLYSRGYRTGSAAIG